MKGLSVSVTHRPDTRSGVDDLEFRVHRRSSYRLGVVFVFYLHIDCRRERETSGVHWSEPLGPITLRCPQPFVKQWGCLLRLLLYPTYEGLDPDHPPPRSRRHKPTRVKTGHTYLTYLFSGNRTPVTFPPTSRQSILPLNGGRWWLLEGRVLTESEPTLETPSIVNQTGNGLLSLRGVLGPLSMV